MQEVERQYMKKKSSLIGPEDNFASSHITAPQTVRVPETLRVGKENNNLYERPKSSKVCGVNFCLFFLLLKFQISKKKCQRMPEKPK